MTDSWSEHLKGRRLLVVEDEYLVAADLAELAGRPVALVDGGVEAWRAAGRPFEASPGEPPDEERIDYIFWNHDRHEGNREAMQAYLRWELDLPGEIARDGPRPLRPASALSQSSSQA